RPPYAGAIARSGGAGRLAIDLLAHQAAPLAGLQSFTIVRGLTARDAQLALSICKRAAGAVTKLGQNREAFSVSSHRPARIEQFDPQSADIARRFSWGRRSLAHGHGNAAHGANGSLAGHRSISNSQDVPFDSVSDRLKQFSRQFTATIILIDQRKHVPRRVGRCVAKSG